MERTDTAKGGNQNYKVLNHILTYGSITSLEAFRVLGVTRLSGRIYDLKSLGYPITRTLESCVNEHGDRTRYARYSLRKEGKDNVKLQF